MVSTKHVFWQALVSAILIFLLGIMIGVVFENSRNSQLEDVLLNSEINILDSQVEGELLRNLGVECNFSIEELVIFADKIYDEAVLLEKYDDSSKLTETVTILHKKYDLLRVLLLTQSINLRDNCGEDLHTIVYIYQYREPRSEIRSEQVVFSRVLEDIKRKYGNRVILIPMAGDLELGSVEVIKHRYGIDEYPVVVLDENYVIRNLEGLKDIEEILFNIKQ